MKQKEDNTSEVEESIKILEELLKFLKSRKYFSRPPNYYNVINTIIILKDNLREHSELCSFVKNEIDPIFKTIIRDYKTCKSESLKTRIFGQILHIIQFRIKRLSLIDYVENDDVINNTVGFYENKIKELQHKSKEDSLRRDEQIERLQEKLEAKEKEEDAKKNWQNKIEETFETLKKYLGPIKDEKNRLNILFLTYACLIIILIGIIILVIVLVICKLKEQSELPKLKEYIEIIFPLPIVGLLLWGFIAQMNRAQRQLVVLAKSIHKVEYIQGLLLSINSLSQTVEDGVSRINAALDRLIENHLNDSDVESEVGLLKEENKDSLPFNSVLKLIKECKDLSKK